MIQMIQIHMIQIHMSLRTYPPGVLAFVRLLLEKRNEDRA